MEIGDRIRKFRKMRGLTQEQLAAGIGVNKSAVAQWETSTGKVRTGISRDNLLAVAKFLKVKVSDLTGDSADNIGLTITDPAEIALVESLRKLTPKQQSMFLDFVDVTLELGQRQKHSSDPPNRGAVTSRRIAKQAT